MRIRMSNKIKTIFDYISVSSSRITLSVTIFNITYILVMYWVGSCNGGAGSLQAHKFLFVFFITIWLPHGQLWDIIEKTASLTRCQ